MRFLLDTHTFLWWTLEPEKLPPKVMDIMGDPGHTVVFSVVSAWEALIKAGIGKLVLQESLESIIRRELARNSWDVLPVNLAHTLKLAELPLLHKDPFDRLLIAQSFVEGLTILGRDPVFSAYAGVHVFWE